MTWNPDVEWRARAADALDAWLAEGVVPLPLRRQVAAMVRNSGVDRWHHTRFEPSPGGRVWVELAANGSAPTARRGFTLHNLLSLRAAGRRGPNGGK